MEWHSLGCSRRQLLIISKLGHIILTKLLNIGLKISQLMRPTAAPGSWPLDAPNKTSNLWPIHIIIGQNVCQIFLGKCRFWPKNGVAGKNDSLQNLTKIMSCCRGRHWGAVSSSVSSPSQSRRRVLIYSLGRAVATVYPWPAPVIMKSKVNIGIRLILRNHYRALQPAAAGRHKNIIIITCILRCWEAQLQENKWGLICSYIWFTIDCILRSKSGKSNSGQNVAKNHKKAYLGQCY